jgi:uncharacterized protein YcbK (DUF882 family)
MLQDSVHIMGNAMTSQTAGVDLKQLTTVLLVPTFEGQWYI